MNLTLKHVAATAACAAALTAQAANINVSTGYTSALSQVSAVDYQTVVNAAVATPSAGYGSTSVSLYDNVSNQSLFSGSSRDIAFKSVIDFGVADSQAGNWGFRFGVDFGSGGAVFLDGVAMDMRTTDMWWAGSYGNVTQFLKFDTVLSAGNHQITLFGIEHCCDGGQQAQYRMAGSTDFVTFSSATLAPVPEPETYAMLLAGLGVMGAIARRRNAAKA